MNQLEKEQLEKKLSDAVLNMEDEEIAGMAQEYLDLGYPAFDGIMNGLIPGMTEAGRLYDEEEYFITDILLCSDAMYEGLNVLRPHLKSEDTKEKVKGIIGVVEGDTHDIGKNLVKNMLETAGFEMIDLGRDVKLNEFVSAAKDNDAKLIVMSTLMSTTMSGMEKVINMLSEEGLREKVKVMVGGGPISSRFAQKIGADAYSSNAIEAVKVAKSLLGIAG